MSQAFIQKHLAGGASRRSSRGPQEIFVFRLSDIASGAFLGTEVSVLGWGLLSTMWIESVAAAVINTVLYKNAAARVYRAWLPGAKLGTMSQVR